VISNDTANQLRSMMRWLEDEGHITPMGVSMLDKIIDAAQEKQ